MKNSVEQEIIDCIENASNNIVKLIFKNVDQKIANLTIGEVKPETTVSDSEEVVETPVKPKRTRRTKAQIEADKQAEEEANKAPESEIVEEEANKAPESEETTEYERGKALVEKLTAEEPEEVEEPKKTVPVKPKRKVPAKPKMPTE